MTLSSRQKLLGAVAVAGLTLGLSAHSADAQYYHRGWGGPGPGAVAAGVVGGLALGAIAAGAASQPYYDGGPGYGPTPVYVAPGPTCWFEREDVWNGFAYVPHRVRVCR